jgi:hypothetical protein
MYSLYFDYDQSGDGIEAFIQNNLKKVIAEWLNRSWNEKINFDGKGEKQVFSSRPDEESERHIAESLAQAICMTIDKATENLAEICKAGVNQEITKQNMVARTIKSIREDIAEIAKGDTSIPKEEKVNRVKFFITSFCKRLLNRSWRETKEITNKLGVQNTASLDDVILPEKIEDITNTVSDFVATTSNSNAEMKTVVLLDRIIKKSEEFDNEEKLPEIVRKAFESSLLSEEEKILKKLFTLDCLITSFDKFGWQLIFSPALAVQIAKDAFVYINDTKAAIKTAIQQREYTQI